MSKLMGAIKETNSQIAKAFATILPKYAKPVLQWIAGITWVVTPAISAIIINSHLHFANPAALLPSNDALICIGITVLQIFWLLYWAYILNKAYSAFDRLWSWCWK